MDHAFECMGEPLARDFDAQMFSRYREKRLKDEYSRSNRVKEVSPRTLNLELAYFRAVFNELNRLGEYKRHDHPDLETVVRICLATGARWSEAENLRKSQLAKYKITYTNTKGRKTALFQSAKSSTSLCLMIKKVGCLVIVMVRFGLLSKEQASSFPQDNLPTFCATPLPAT